MVHVSVARLQRALLPPTCVLCAGEGQGDNIDLCAACSGDLLVNGNACACCAEQLTGAIGAAPVCGACLRKPPRYDSTHCAFRYRFPVDHLVRALKYHGRLAHARVLGRLLARSLADTARDAWPQALIPVPLAKQRFNERGFNQAIEIAKHLEKELQISLRADLLERRRDTREQAGLDRIARRKNVRGAFALQGPLHAEHIAIIDDVVTTGSTANEVARVLKRAGAKRIEVWAVARAAR
jgi:ComF family protein